MKKTIIIVPTHSSYIDIVKIFLALLRKYWNECDYEIVISIVGDKTQIEGYETIYNGKNASLIDCILKAAKAYKSEFYFSFLGDAFITNKIDNKTVYKIMEEIRENKIEYCSLNFEKRYTKEKKCTDLLRYINEKDRYSHSFVSFIASRKYITDTLSTFKDDLDFEKYYLSKKTDSYYGNHAIVRKNYLNITPSIIKGKWDYINFSRISKNNPEIFLGNREKNTIINSIILHIRSKVNPFIPKGIRAIINKHRGGMK